MTSFDKESPVAAEPMVRAVNIHKRFGTIEVLRGIDLEVPRGSVTCLIGPSGSGKTTMLRCINHLEKINRGRLTVDGELIGYREAGGRLHEIKPREAARQRREIGMVFQHFNLFPHMTVLQNIVEAPTKVKRVDRKDAVADAETLLARVGLSDKARMYPAQLSGGQQQRVAIARALAMKPKLMLFDEPTSALDPELVGEVLAVIKDLAAQGWTTVIVTHEVRFAEQVADQVLFLDGGVVVEHGPPSQVIGDPQQERTQRFLRRVLHPGGA